MAKIQNCKTRSPIAVPRRWPLRLQTHAVLADNGLLARFLESWTSLNLYVIYVWNTSCYYFEYASNCMHVYIHNDIYLHTCVQMHAYMTTTMQRSSLGRRLYRYEYLHSGEYVNIPAPHQYEHVSPFIVIIAQSICVVAQSISVNDDIVSVCIMHLSVSSTNMCNLLFAKPESLCANPNPRWYHRLWIITITDLHESILWFRETADTQKSSQISQT